MPTHTRYRLHSNGPALWPERKGNEEVAQLKLNTLEQVWETTWQGNDAPPAGTVFRRSWWLPPQRYDPLDQGLVNQCLARFLILDTAETDKLTSAYTAMLVGELLPDYRLVLRFAWRDRLEFPDLPETILDWARRFNFDGKLRKIVIEAKSTGGPALQTLRRSPERWIVPLLADFTPHVDKLTRANMSAVWCKRACVLLPMPGPAVPWLFEFEEELFSFPGSEFKDYVDAFSQMLLYLENYLDAGHRLRSPT